MSSAVDQLQVQHTTTWSLRIENSMDPGHYFWDTQVGYLTIDGHKRPETVYNPPNDIGLRAMSNWSRSWLRVSQPLRPLSTKSTVGYPVGIISSGSRISALGFTYLTGTWQDMDWVKPTPWSLVTSDSKARNNVLRKASQVKWDLLVTAGELRETADFVTDIARNTANAYIKYRNAGRLEGYKGDLLRAYDRWIADAKAAESKLSWIKRGLMECKLQGLTDVTAKGLESFRDKWMSYQFGVKPLIADVGNMIEYFDQLPPESLPAVKLKAGAVSEYEYDLPGVRIWSTVEQNFQARGTVDTHYVLICRKTPTGMSTASQLGLNRGLSTAWELTRLSWLVDGLVDIGGWLQAWYARDDVSFVEGCKSTIWRGNVILKGEPVIINPTQTWDQKWKPVLLFEAGAFRREVLSSLPVPGIMPNIKELTGVTRCLNTLFGVLGVFGRKRA